VFVSLAFQLSFENLCIWIFFFFLNGSADLVLFTIVDVQTSELMILTLSSVLCLGY
jgi:hypothetical protein